MSWDLRYPSSTLVHSYRASCIWPDATLAQLTFDGIKGAGGARCRVRSATRPFEGSVAGVGDMGLRLAATLARRGVGAGDVVAFQLPNWAEAAACIYGLLPLGVVVVPIVHIYGAKELDHILRQSGARAFITTERFGRQDYLANLEACDAPALEVVVVVDDGNPLPRGALSWAQALASDPLAAAANVDPDSPAVIGYTSGTTAAPKGVIHSHRSFLADIATWGVFAKDDRTPPPAISPRGSLVAAPLGHITGLVPALRPILSGGPLHLLDAWDPAVVLDAIATDGLSAGGGAPFFLISLLDHPGFDAAVHSPYISKLVMGGAPVPAEVAQRATDLGISVTRAYGSTEHPSTTGSLHSDPVDKKTRTDGRLMPGSEIRLVDGDGCDVSLGEPGEIRSRGPELFIGYTDPALTADAIDGAGWYDTGDVGVLDADGYLTITDRKKDIIIRGGENVSAAEVEGLILRIPGVAEVAVVAAPDARYGEHGAALVRLHPGATAFGLDAVQQHLRGCGLARQKWPEELSVVDEFPRTPSGKIQKHVLRARLAKGQSAQA